MVIAATWRSFLGSELNPLAGFGSSQGKGDLKTKSEWIAGIYKKISKKILLMRELEGFLAQ